MHTSTENKPMAAGQEEVGDGRKRRRDGVQAAGGESWGCGVWRREHGQHRCNECVVPGGDETHQGTVCKLHKCLSTMLYP